MVNWLGQYPWKQEDSHVAHLQISICPQCIFHEKDFLFSLKFSCMISQNLRVLKWKVLHNLSLDSCWNVSQNLGERNKIAQQLNVWRVLKLRHLFYAQKADRAHCYHYYCHNIGLRQIILFNSGGKLRVKGLFSLLLSNIQILTAMIHGTKLNMVLREYQQLSPVYMSNYLRYFLYKTGLMLKIESEEEM